MKRNGIYFEQGYMTSELKYHYSWDWLMPVVNVIESILDDSQSNDIVGYHLYDVEIKQDVCIIHGANIECSFADKLTNTYEAVVEFIEFYNKNK
jgi:hypothetical protein